MKKRGRPPKNPPAMPEVLPTAHGFLPPDPPDEPTAPASPAPSFDLYSVEGRAALARAVGDRFPTIVTLIKLVDQGEVFRRKYNIASEAFEEWFDWIQAGWEDDDVESLKAFEGYETVRDFFASGDSPGD